MKFSRTKLQAAVASVLMRNYLRPEKRRQTNLVVSGFPKSGTTWASQLCSGYLDLDYVRNVVRLQRSNTLLHTHSVDFQGHRNILYVVRDPREVICSAARTIDRDRRDEVFDADGKVLPSFADYVMDRFPGATTSMSAHLQRCLDNDWPVMRFEDLKDHATATMISFLTDRGEEVDKDKLAQVVDRFDFSRLKSTQPSDKFLAQSSVSSWTSMLPQPVLENVANKIGPIAKEFGYTLESEQPDR